MIDQQKLTDLRSKAQSATPGPWVAEEECVVQPWPDPISPLGLTEGASILVAECGGVAFDSPRPNDAAFIAAANPATVLALIDEIERLRGMVKMLEWERGVEIHRLKVKLKRLRGAAEPCVDALRDIAGDGHECYLDEWDAAVDAAKEATDG